MRALIACWASIDAPRPLLGTAIDVDRPSGVAEVPLQLADDRRHRKRGEGEASVRIEPLDGLHQPEARHLHEVVVRLARLRVARGPACVPAARTARSARRVPHGLCPGANARTALASQPWTRAHQRGFPTPGTSFRRPTSFSTENRLLCRKIAVANPFVGPPVMWVFGWVPRLSGCGARRCDGPGRVPWLRAARTGRTGVRGARSPHRSPRSAGPPRRRRPAPRRGSARRAARCERRRRVAYRPASAAFIAVPAALAPVVPAVRAVLRAFRAVPTRLRACDGQSP